MTDHPENAASDRLEQVAFQRLTRDQLEALKPSATRRACPDGQVLWAAGECDYRFFAIESGRVAIYEGDPRDGREVTVHEAGEFTGDIDVLTGNPSLVTGVARGECVAYEISSDRIRELIREVPWLGDILLEAFIARRRLLSDSGDHPLRVIGSRYSSDTNRIRQFLSRNGVPFTWIDAETDTRIEQVLRALNVTAAETPVVECAAGLLRNPSTETLADTLGIRRAAEAHVYDLVIVGAGPAGLAAAVYAASEGLDTVVMEQVAPGGQAGCSSRIENYLGFPSGISGAELTELAMMQAFKFGAQVSNPSQVTGLDTSKPIREILLQSGEHVQARAVIIASGAEYRRLAIEGRERFDGAGIYYSATQTEAPLCDGHDAVVVGAGNSAGQAAVFLSDHASRVLLVVRGDDLAASMSRYLIRRIEECDRIEVLLQSEVDRLQGDVRLEAVEIVNHATGERRRVATCTLFSMIGAVPRTDWVPGDIAMDQKRFIKTGAGTSLGRRVLLLETNVPGIFAAGDVRSGSSKRVATAVGEGSMAVQLVHQYLADE